MALWPSLMAKSTLLPLIAAALAHAKLSLALKHRRVDEGPNLFVPMQLSDAWLLGGVHGVTDADRGLLLEGKETTQRSGSTSSDGVLCQTLLHTEIHDKHYFPFAQSALGPSLAAGFDEELSRQCKAGYPSEWDHLFENYSGKWSDHAVTALDNSIFGSLGEWLNAERQRQEEKASTWDNFRNGKVEVSRYEGLLRRLATGPLVRVLDFGCGDGVELAKTARGLGLAQSDALALDIYEGVSEQVRSKVTFLLADPAEDAYGPALEAHLNNGIKGTVSAVFSVVTFHHIKKPVIRVAALKFIREALTPDGFFLFADWDNVGVPIDFSIYFDLAHFLPSLWFSNPAPTSFQIQPLDTEYLSVQGWIDLMGSSGLPFDSERSKFPYLTRENKEVLLDPVVAANSSSGRNFMAVFGKGTVPASALQ